MSAPPTDPAPAAAPAAAAAAVAQPPAAPTRRMIQRTMTPQGTLVPLEQNDETFEWNAQRKVQFQSAIEVEYSHLEEGAKKHIKLTVSTPSTASATTMVNMFLASGKVPVPDKVKEAAQAEIEAAQERLKRTVTQGRKRTAFTLQEKFDHAKAAQERKKRAEYWREHGIKHSTGEGWVKNYDNLRRLCVGADSLTLNALKNRGIKASTLVRERMCTAFWAALREAYVSVNLSLLSALLHHKDETWRSWDSSTRSMFLQRWMQRNNLSVRKNSGIQQVLPQDMEKQAVLYKTKLSTMNQKYGFTCVVAADETQVLFNVYADTVVAERGSKKVNVVQSHGIDKREGCTVLLSARSTLTVKGGKPFKHTEALPALVLFKGGKAVRTKTVKEAGKTACLIDTTESGWQTAQSFASWVKKLKRPPGWSDGDEPKGLLIVDVHKSHIAEEVKKAAKSRGFLMAFIPPGCTSVLQIHDVYVNKTFKAKIKEEFSRTFFHENGELKSQEELREKLPVHDRRLRVLTWIEAANQDKAILANLYEGFDHLAWQPLNLPPDACPPEDRAVAARQDASVPPRLEGEPDLDDDDLERVRQMVADLNFDIQPDETPVGNVHVENLDADETPDSDDDGAAEVSSEASDVVEDEDDGEPPVRRHRPENP